MTRVRIFVIVAVACLATAVAAVTVGVLQAGPGQASEGASSALDSARAAGRSMVVMRSLASETRDQVELVQAGDAGSPPEVSDLRCERVHFNAGTGVCVARGGGFAAGYGARIFGSDLRVSHEIDLAGVPSRARVSRDGRLGAVTMFVTGHSYAGDSFSTETTLLDLRAGTKIGNLEEFTVSRHGRVVTAVDVNFWGVTFAEDGDTFYATLATGGKTYLVRGSIRDRTMRTLHENVECPSLSPDGTRIAYKQRAGSGENPWRLAVLDLATMQETVLPGTDGLDDQAEWLDDDRILYGADGEVRVVAADGSGPPATFRAGADSPAVIRW
jgi:hypothetical protein